MFFYKKGLGCFWSESLLFRVCLLQVQKAETDDVILALFFFNKGGFAIVYWISRWVCGNEQQCKHLALDTWVSSKLPRKALSMPFSHYLYSFLLFHMCLHVQTFPMVLHLQMWKRLLFQRSQISYTREISSLASGKIWRFFPFLSGSSLVIPFFGCSSPSPGDFLLYARLRRKLRRFLFNLIFELRDSLRVILRLRRGIVGSCLHCCPALWNS